MKNKNIPHYIVIDNPFTKLNEEKEFSLYNSKMDMIHYTQDKDISNSNLNESVIKDKKYSKRKNNLTISKNLMSSSNSSKI